MVVATESREVYQVVEALSYGDAVSSITRRNARLLSEMGHGKVISALNADPRVAREITPIDSVASAGGGALIFHYCCYSELEDLLRSFPGPKAVHYHNITPAKYFPRGSEAYAYTAQGYHQLERIAGWFDLIIGDSEYDLVEYAKFLGNAKPTLWLPPLLEPEEILGRPFDATTVDWLRQEAEGIKFLFVGRIAPNKRQDLLIQTFDHYFREIDRHSYLFIVGANHTTQYMEELEVLRRSLPSRDHIIFSGHLTDEELASYYRACDVFICASEHEGFGVPLIEAMAHGLLVVAFNASAVPETLGGSGLLIHDWDSPRVAELINAVLKDASLRTAVLEKQRKNVARFSTAEVSRRLEAAINYLSRGEDSSLITWRGASVTTVTA